MSLSKLRKSLQKRRQKKCKNQREWRTRPSEPAEQGSYELRKTEAARTETTWAYSFELSTFRGFPNVGMSGL